MMIPMPSVLAFMGMNELLIVGGIVVLLFGATKLPQLARAAGSSITQFKKGLKDDEDGDGDGSKALDGEDDGSSAKKELP